MKNLILVLAISMTAGFASAQAAADKSVQAGLVTGFGLSFQNMGTKIMESNGVGNDLTIGANVNFSLTETIGFNTGIEFDFGTLKYKSNPDFGGVYYNYDDANIQSKADTEANQNELFRLEERTQKPVYLSIPTMLVFCKKERRLRRLVRISSKLVLQESRGAGKSSLSCLLDLNIFSPKNTVGLR